MFASKRTIGKQGLYPVVVKESHKIKHNNKSNRRGVRYHSQQVVDKSGKVVKTIIHVKSFGPGAWKIKRRSPRLRKSMKSQPR